MVTTRALHAEEVALPEMPTREGQAWKEVPAVTAREPSEERSLGQRSPEKRDLSQLAM